MKATFDLRVFGHSDEQPNVSFGCSGLISSGENKVMF